MNEPLKILCIGNSFSADMIMYVPELARDYDISLDIEGIGYPGGSIDQQIDFLSNDREVYQHWVFNKDRCRWETKRDVGGVSVIKSKKWDYVVIQECSVSSGRKGGYPRLNEYISLIKSLLTGKNAKFIWQMTWPYASYNKMDVFLKDFDGSEEKMYLGIVNNVKNDVLTNKDIDVVIPTGTAVKNAKQNLAEESIYRDPIHLSFHVGRYIASVNFMKTMFDIDLDRLETEPFGTTLFTRAVVKECVNDTHENPYGVTPTRLNKEDFKQY